MKISKSIIVSGALITISLILGIIVYPQLPERAASHWGINGQVNGYMPKFWSAFLIPLISICMLVLFFVIPKIDPLKSNIKKFRSYYEGFILILIAFLLYIHTISLFWNLGYHFNMTQVLSPATGVLFYYLGIVMGHTKQNWFIGIRTPWTMCSEIVWNKTHQIGGKLFKIAGVIMTLCVLLPHFFFFFMLISITTIILFSYGYSYYLYARLSKNK